MKLIIIAAVSVDGIIGVDDEIPWRIPEDFKHYRETTMGSVLIVGATTFQLLPPKAHEGREFMILSGSGNRLELKGKQYFQFSKLENILTLLEDEKNDFDKVYVIGGARIYDTLIDYCDEAVITWVDKIIPEGNKKFPMLKLINDFNIVNDSGWKTSISGQEYKIVKYIRNHE